jgi:hypothetical protein
MYNRRMRLAKTLDEEELENFAALQRPINLKVDLTELQEKLYRAGRVLEVAEAQLHKFKLEHLDVDFSGKEEANEENVYDDEEDAERFEYSKKLKDKLQKMEAKVKKSRKRTHALEVQVEKIKREIASIRVNASRVTFEQYACDMVEEDFANAEDLGEDEQEGAHQDDGGASSDEDADENVVPAVPTSTTSANSKHVEDWKVQSLCRVYLSKLHFLKNKRKELVGWR